MSENILPLCQPVLHDQKRQFSLGKKKIKSSYMSYLIIIIIIIIPENNKMQ